MNNNKMYSGYRYPAPIISHTVWQYFRFTLSFSDIEELLAARNCYLSSSQFDKLTVPPHNANIAAKYVESKQ